jgi:hypothetical protein
MTPVPPEYEARVIEDYLRNRLEGGLKWLMFVFIGRLRVLLPQLGRHSSASNYCSTRAVGC